MDLGRLRCDYDGWDMFYEVVDFWDDKFVGDDGLKDGENGRLFFRFFEIGINDFDEVLKLVFRDFWIFVIF